MCDGIIKTAVFLPVVLAVTFSGCGNAEYVQRDKDLTDLTSITREDTGVPSNENSSDISDEEYLKNLDYVHKRLDELLHSDDFIKSDLNVRVKLVERRVNELIKEGYLLSCNAELDGNVPKITFDYAGGGVGAVMLDDFPEGYN